MLNPRLQKAYESLTRWCDRHQIVFDLVCDEDDLQGYLIPRRYRSLTPRFTEFLSNLCEREGLYMREQSTRSGTVYALSLVAISETAMEAVTPVTERSRLARRLDLVYDGLMPFQQELLRQIGETQYHSPSTAQRRQYARPTQTIGYKLTKRLQEDLGFLSIGDIVLEALDGIAAEYQPMDVLKQFESALRKLGLLDTLKAAGVTNKLSRDKQILHFYINDGDGRQREIASYELVKLAEGNNMEKAIKDLTDVGRKRAPGTTDREVQQVRDKEQKIRQVAKEFSPEALRKAQEMHQGEDQAEPAPAQLPGPGAMVGQAVESTLSSRLEQLLVDN